MPDSIKQMIEKQLDHLDAEQQRRTLEAASVAGAEFSTLAVVAGLGEDRAAVEARCDELARQRQFIQDCGVQRTTKWRSGDAVRLHTRSCIRTCCMSGCPRPGAFNCTGG